ncbi:HAMP domain-containing sensor histidine kinase [Virgibacillus halophilus]|uniref:histidine kinase n=2 Tax=Tigheibacillus halophilus TaxID=361280 RepID=A0ABU5C3V3_9BACI|nr:HAMP domain-containing sensor histidine kinase [Virgibacillus halophilus]
MLVISFSYIAKYVLIFFLMYGGAYVFVKSICYKLSESVFIFCYMLLTTFGMLAFQELYHENFSFAAHFLIIGLSSFVHIYLPREKNYMAIFTVVLLLLLSAIQWLQLVPLVTPFGFGSDDIAAAIKMADGYFNGYELLNTLATIFFAVFLVLAAIFFVLAMIQDKQMHTRKKFEVQGAALRKTRHALVESKVYEEMANLVHDLKTPLVTVEGLVSLIELQMQAAHDSAAAAYFQRIENSVEKMKDMISEILDEHVKKEIEAAELLHYVTSHLALDDQFVQLHIHIEEPVPMIHINKIRFSRALSNVIENAVHSFAGKQGNIWIRVLTEQEQVIFSVRDDGSGIAEKDLHAIFEEGFSSRESSGLGLAFVRRVVANHGGTVNISSLKGTYTEVRIGLPMKKEPISEVYQHIGSER